jgi:hypothetical protein
VLGRSTNAEAQRIINEALMCRMFRCRPSELENEDNQKLEMFMITEILTFELLFLRKLIDDEFIIKNTPILFT